jgi:hypothetical protein
MLKRGDLIPHFLVTTREGHRERYADIWQHQHLVLLVLEPGSVADYNTRFAARAPEFVTADTAVIVTDDNVRGVPQPGVVVADRWGEIVHIAALTEETLPAADELLEWITYTRMRCPECEGEAK